MEISLNIGRLGIYIVNYNLEVPFK